MEVPMSFEWLRMRIQEEQDRRNREASTLGRLPMAMQELHGVLKQCLDGYTKAFGADSASIVKLNNRIKITVCEEANGRWQNTSKVEVLTVSELPGIRIERGE